MRPLELYATPDNGPGIGLRFLKLKLLELKRRLAFGCVHVPSTEIAIADWEGPDGK